MAENPMSNEYVFGIRGMDMKFERMYKKYGSTMNRMFKGKKLSSDEAFGVLQYMENNPDMSYVELKNALIPPKKQKLKMGGPVHRGRKAGASFEKEGN